MAIPSPRVLTIDELTIEEREELHREGARVAGLATFRAELGESSVYSNELMALFGVGDGEPVSAARLIETLHPEDRPRAQRALETVLREGHIPPIDVRIVRPDGTVRYVRGMGERVVRGDGKAVLFGVIRDITAQREAELAATLHLYSLEEAQRIAGVGSFIMTLEDQQIRWTTGMYRIAGIEPGTTITPEVTSRMIHPDDVARNVAWFREIAAGAPPEPILVRSIRPDGQMRWTETHAAKVRFEDGIDRVVGTTIDLTDRIALEDRLRHAAKMEAIGTLAAGLAHDFNNYLTVIATNVELAAQQSAGSEPLADVTHAVQQCATLTRQLLAFARRQPAQARVVDLGAIVRRAARLLARLLDERIDLSVEVPSEPVPVEADPAHLEQVVLNLATNARDAVGDSGTITLRVRRGESQAGPEAILEVADDGAGIDPAHLPNIFDPYFTTKSAGEGTGLGLASVYGTVRQNRGTVSVHSARGEGTTFEVSFPLASGATIEDPGSASVAGRSHQGTVLVVEDMPDVRRVLARALRGAGYETLEASDGVAALGILDERLAAGTRLDAIVSDVVMPRMDGPALAREVQVRAPGTPVVFVTGYADQPLPTTGGPVALLTKPFRLSDLVETVSSLVERARLG